MKYEGLNQYLSQVREYTELRVQENKETIVLLANGNVIQNRSQVVGGSSARAFNNGVWGFASNPRDDREAIARVVELATTNARFLSEKEGRALVDLPRKPGAGAFDYSTSRPRVEQRVIMEFVKSIDAYIAEKYKDICARSVILGGLDMEKTMIASDGGSGYSLTPQTTLYVEMATEAGQNTVKVHDVFGGLANGKACPVPVHVDDEGTEARDVVLIENGVLRNFMHNKETAAHFGVEPMGNARAHEFSDEPLVRMRNTAINPGTSSLDDMISDVNDGYYLVRPSNGQADTTSEFMFGVVIGYEIKKGKIGRAIRDVTISGVAFDMLKTVTALSDDMVWLRGGMCGKKQLIPVGMGGPALRCRIMIGGRR